MTRLVLLALLLAVGCSPDGRDTPVTSEIDPPAPSISDLARLDTLRIRADATSLDDRPRAPLIVDGACPFEGCQYGEWTTSDSTAVYSAAGDTTSVAFRVPEQTPLTADRGFVVVTRLGRSVARQAAEIYVGPVDTAPVAAGDTLSILDYEGEGSYRAWADGVLGFSGEVVPFGDADDGPFQLLDDPRAQWWAHVILADGRSGWLWMDRTPPVSGADSLE